MAGFVESPDHFINYINRRLRESDQTVSESQLLNSEFYVDEIYRNGLADAFTWDLRQKGVHLLEEDNLLEWLSRQKNPSIKYSSFSHQFADAFKEAIEPLHGRAGVYSFWNESETCMYVGRSTANLGDRIPGSFSRFNNYEGIVYARWIVTDSAPDACILELYFINELCPSLNSRDAFSNDECTLDISPIPEWTSPVQVNLSLT